MRRANLRSPTIIVVMGVSGCGKTTVGSRLAKVCGWKFFDADEFHPAENIAKMSAGDALADADREPWLARLNQLGSGCARDGESAVMACSALKQAYRERLAQGIASIRFVYLRGDFAVINARMLARKDHYMKAGMLESQFAALEEPEDAVIADIVQAPDVIVARICAALNLFPGGIQRN